MRHRWHRCADMQYKDGVDPQLSRIYRDKAPGQHLCRLPINAGGCCISVIFCQRPPNYAAHRHFSASGIASWLWARRGMVKYALRPARARLVPCAKLPVWRITHVPHRRQGQRRCLAQGMKKACARMRVQAFHLSEVTARSWTAFASSVWRSGRKRLRQSTNPKWRGPKSR